MMESSERAQAQYNQNITEHHHKKLTDKRLLNKEGLFGSSESMALLLGVPHFRTPITGRIYRSSEEEALLMAQSNGVQLDEIRYRYEELWSMTKFFWDVMLRTQPNRFTSHEELTKQAVDFMLDVMVGCILPDVKPDYDPELANVQLQMLNRRLTIMESRLRDDMIGVPDTLCTCTTPYKWSKKKEIWKRNEEGDRGFRFRDIAGLQRLDDFLAREFEHHNNPKNPQERQAVLRTVILLMDDEVKKYLPKKDYGNTNELKSEWLYVLCHPAFRSSVVLEVMNLVNDALKFHKGTAHREGCGFGTAVKAAPTTASTTKRPGGFRLAFWRKD